MRHECLCLYHAGTRLLRFGFHLLLAGDSHGATLLCLRLCDVLIGLRLVHLQLCTDVLTYIDVRDVDTEDFESGPFVQALAEHEFRDAVGVLKHLLVALCGADRTDDTFAYTRQDGVLTGTTHQLADVRADGNTRLCYQLNTVFCHCRYGRGVNHLGVHRHLYCFEHITTCQVYRSSHLEGKFHARLVGRDKGMHHALDMPAGEVVRLQSVALHILQTRLVRLDEAVHNLRRGHLTDAHEEQLYQRDTNTTHLCVYPQHKRHIVEKDNQKNAENNQQNNSKDIHNSKRLIVSIF